MKACSHCVLSLVSGDPLKVFVIYTFKNIVQIPTLSSLDSFEEYNERDYPSISTINVNNNDAAIC